jgi:hypothetical protein
LKRITFSPGREALDEARRRVSLHAGEIEVARCRDHSFLRAQP